MLKIDKLIGASLVERGVLTDEQVAQILQHSETTGLKFSEAGRALGILKNHAPVRVGRNAIAFFHIEPEFFPESTAALLPRESVVKYGAVPLGFKTSYRFFRPQKWINVGFLDPSHLASIDEVEKQVKQRLDTRGYGGIRRYLVLADQFVELLETVYRWEAGTLLALPEGQIEPVLRKFLITAAQKPVV